MPVRSILTASGRRGGHLRLTAAYRLGLDLARSTAWGLCCGAASSRPSMPDEARQTRCMPELEDDSDTKGQQRLSNAALIERAAEALNPQLLGEGFWVADVGAAVEAEDG